MTRKTYNNEEIKTFEEYRDKGKPVDLRNKLVTNYLPLLRFLVGKTHEKLPNSVEAGDLYGDGALGLIYGVKSYDLSSGLKPSTYLSYRIKGEMIDGLRRRDNFSRGLRATRNKVRKIRDGFLEEHGRHISPIELSSMNVSPTELRLSSLDLHSLFDDYRAYAESINDSSASLTDKVEDKELIGLIMDNVSNDEWKLIHLLYFEGLTYREAAKLMKLSEPRISRINGETLKRLNKRFEKKVRSY